MKRISALICLIVAICAANAFALFDVNYYGVRALGMGQAFTAVANDVNAPIYNIAGTGLLDRIEVAGMSSRLFAGEEGLNFTTNFIGTVVPLSRDKSYGTISAGWGNYSDVGLYDENIVYVGYARHLGDLFETELFDIALGVNFRYLHHKVNGRELSTPVEGYLSEDAFTFDAGVLIKLKNGISAGYSGKYLTSPDVRFFKETSEKENVQIHHVIGLAYFNELLPLLRLPNFTIAGDFEIREHDNVIMLGAETKIKISESFLSFRAGGWQEQLTFGVGYSIPFGSTEADRSYLTVDYAFILPLEIQNTIGSHFFGLSYRFK